MSWDPNYLPYPFVPGDKRPLFFNPKPNSSATRAPEYRGPWVYDDQQPNSRKRQRSTNENVKKEVKPAAQEPDPKTEDPEKNGEEELYRPWLVRLGVANPDPNTEPEQYPPTYPQFITQDELRLQNKRQRAQEEHHHAQDHPARKVRVTQTLKAHHNSRKYRITDSIGDTVLNWVTGTLPVLLPTYGGRAFDWISDSTALRPARWFLNSTWGVGIQLWHTHLHRKHMRHALDNDLSIRPHCKHLGKEERVRGNHRAMLEWGGMHDVPDLPEEMRDDARYEAWAERRIQEIREKLLTEFYVREALRVQSQQADVEDLSNGAPQEDDVPVVERTRPARHQPTVNSRMKEEINHSPGTRILSFGRTRQPKYQAYAVDEDDENSDLYEQDIDVEYIRGRETVLQEESQPGPDNDSSDDDLFKVDIDNTSEDGLRSTGLLEVRDSKGRRRVLQNPSNMPMTMLLMDGPMVVDDEGAGTVFRNPLTEKVINMEDESDDRGHSGTLSSSSDSDGNDGSDNGSDAASDDSDSASSDSDEDPPMPWNQPRKPDSGNSGGTSFSDSDRDDNICPPPISTSLPPHLIPCRVPKSTSVVCRRPRVLRSPSTTSFQQLRPESPTSSVSGSLSASTFSSTSTPQSPRSPASYASYKPTKTLKEWKNIIPTSKGPTQATKSQPSKPAEAKEPSESWMRLLAHSKTSGFKPQLSGPRRTLFTASPGLAKASKPSKSTQPSASWQKRLEVSKSSSFKPSSPAYGTPSKPTAGPMNIFSESNQRSKTSQGSTAEKPTTSRPDVPDIIVTGPNSLSGTPGSQTSQLDAEPKEPSELALTGSVPKAAHSSSTAEGGTTIPTPPSQPSRPAPQNVQAADEPLINTTMARLLNGGVDFVGNGILTLMGTAEQAPTATSSPGSYATTKPGLGNSILGAKKPAGPISQPTQASRYSQQNPVRHNNDDDDDDGIVCPECTFSNAPGAKWCSMCIAPFEELPSLAPNPKSRARLVQLEDYSDDEDGVLVYTRSRPSTYRQPIYEMTGGAGPVGTNDNSGNTVPISEEERARLSGERERQKLADSNRVAYAVATGRKMIHEPYFHDPGYTEEYRREVEAQMEAASTGAAKHKDELRKARKKTQQLQQEREEKRRREKEHRDLDFLDKIRQAREIMKENRQTFPEGMPGWARLSEEDQQAVLDAATALDQQAKLELKAKRSGNQGEKKRGGQKSKQRDEQEKKDRKYLEKREEYRKKGKRFPEDLPTWATTSEEKRRHCLEALATLEAQEELECASQTGGAAGGECDASPEEERIQLLQQLAALREEHGDAFPECLPWNTYTEAQQEQIFLAISELAAQDEVLRNISES